MVLYVFKWKSVVSVFFGVGLKNVPRSIARNVLLLLTFWADFLRVLLQICLLLKMAIQHHLDLLVVVHYA